MLFRFSINMQAICEEKKIQKKVEKKCGQKRVVKDYKYIFK